MTLKTVVLSATLLLGVSLGAHAQAGVYGMLSTERASNVTCTAAVSQVVPTTCSSEDRIDRAEGAGGGVYYDFFSLGKARLGVDVRGDIQKSNKSASNTIAGNNALRMDEVMGGVRASFLLRKNKLKPYVEAAMGWDRRDRTTNFIAYRVYGGLDIALLSVMDLRIAEISVGQNIGRNGVSTNTVETGSIGVVFHLPTH